MTRIAVGDDVATQIRESDGPIELVDASGQTVGVVRRPPTESEITRAKSRATQDGQRLTWTEVVAQVQGGTNG
ncbi:MAG: hypothetical protein KDA60_06810 [Planctomycetales bacterium]|nr:hypothetical protein [Planctomycetales bacterium]